MILAAGLSPAWQQVLVFDGFTPGAVNRAREAHWCASGKVLNAARALHSLGGPCKALTVVGGRTGEDVRADCARIGLAARWVPTAAPTRVCTTILDRGLRGATKLVPEAPPVTPDEIAAFSDAFAEEASAATVVVLIGSMPAGAPPGLFADLLARTPPRAVLDIRGPELLAALPARPLLVKPNREELARTVGRNLENDAGLFDAMREVNERGAEWVLITDGKRPAYARSAQGLFRITPPERDVVNPIGCGDCLAAGVASATARGREPLDAIRFGMAAAADKAGRLLPGSINAEAVAAVAECLAVDRLASG